MNKADYPYYNIILNYGSGFDDTDVKNIYIDKKSDKVSIDLDLAKKCDFIKIKFSEKHYWIVGNCCFKTDNCELKYITNSTKKVNSDFEIYSLHGSYIVISVPENCSHLILEFEYTVIDSSLDPILTKIIDEYLKNANQLSSVTARLSKATQDSHKFAFLYKEISNSFYWKLTFPFRTVTAFLKKHIIEKSKPLKYSAIYFKALLRRGPGYASKKIKNLRILNGENVKHSISKKQFNEERNFIFPKNIKFSILVPLYNTPKKFLIEMIDSVIGQTYTNWELCLADGSDFEHKYVEEICSNYSENDHRVIYKKLKENKGISENTNECIKMASGEYIALFDHDDILHPSALFENMKVICDKNADYIYTDEATFDGNRGLNDIITCHYKPDFAYDNLLANNYICHFSVFKSELIDKVGMFRTKYDGSQDHDMILRLTAASEIICHIPKILYFWRSHKNSVAMDINSKSYAIDSGKRLVHDFLQDKGIETSVESSPAFPTIYRINYSIIDNPKISIIITNHNRYDYIKKCLETILRNSTYNNYEILIVDTQSDDKPLLEYYNTITIYDNIKVLNYSEEYNYAAVNNFAASKATGEYLLFLNSDTTIITDNWMEELLMYAQRENVGAVGAKLFYYDNTVQHGGIILQWDASGDFRFSHNGVDRDNFGYMGRMYYAQDVSAVSSACMMIKRSLFMEIGMFSTDYLRFYFDVDLCLRLRNKKYLNVFNPFCEIYHLTEKNKTFSKEDSKTLKSDKEIFLKKWDNDIQNNDPFFNPNITV